MQKAEGEEEELALEDTNCAGLGSQEDKDLRKYAAGFEPAWENCGQKPGLEVWRIEKFKVVAYPPQSYGSFYRGDSYIILHTEKDAESEELHRFIYFWLGDESTADEMGTAAYKTVELDDFFDGQASQHREVMNYESTHFKRLFPHIQYLEGGVDSGFHHVEKGAYKPKLLQVRKTIVGGMKVQEVTLERDSMNQGDCFLLDIGSVVYIWQGDESSAFEKVAAEKAAHGIAKSRHGHCRVETNVDDEFWREIGGTGPIKAANEGTDDIPCAEHGLGMLYDIHVDSNSDTQTHALITTELAHGKEINESLLKSDRAHMLDTDAEIMLWIGKDANKDIRKNVMSAALAYLDANNMANSTPIHVFKEGQNIQNLTWKKIMNGGEGACCVSSGGMPLGIMGSVPEANGKPKLALRQEHHDELHGHLQGHGVSEEHKAVIMHVLGPIVEEMIFDSLKKKMPEDPLPVMLETIRRMKKDHR